MNVSDDEILLEGFILDNPELEKLEQMLDHFNVFEILKIVNTESQHSNVLAWLLNPNSNHGLGEYFLKQLLINFAAQNRNYIQKLGLSRSNFHTFDYKDIEIRREWKNIDLLILFREGNKQIAVVFENKVFSDEHSNQLKRYRQIIETDFKGYLPIYILLTPEITEPSDANWVNFTYNDIVDLLDRLLEAKKDRLKDDIYQFIKQYNIILRRYIVGNGDVEELCRQIYRKHAKALEALSNYAPDFDGQIKDSIKDLLEKDYKNEVTLDDSAKKIIRFTTPMIDSVTPKASEKNWTRSKRILLFEIQISPQDITVCLIIGPGDDNDRKKIYDFCNSFFNKTGTKKLGKMWNTVYRMELLRKNSVGDDNYYNDLIKQFEAQWKNFVQNDLKQIDSHFQNNWK